MGKQIECDKCGYTTDFQRTFGIESDGEDFLGYHNCEDGERPLGKFRYVS